MQGYNCYCEPCVPAPQHKKAATSLATTLGSTALAAVVTIIALLAAAVGALVYKWKQDSKRPMVSMSLLLCGWAMSKASTNPYMLVLMKLCEACVHDHC